MIIATILLLSFSIVVIYSSSPQLATQQLIFSLAGLFFYFLLQHLDYRVLKDITWPLYILGLVLLLVTLVLGIETRGSIRWIPIGPFNFQPSEFGKVFLILTLARFWSTKSPTWLNFFKSILILLPFAFLIFKQPDLGTTLTVVFIWFVAFLASNISFKKALLVFLIGIFLIPLSFIFMQDYQKQRIRGFLTPTADPQGIGFHVIQSQIAVGSGEVFGRGLGRGTQSRLQFLPEFRTDFIFAFIAEELGFLGSFIIISLYLVIFYISLKVVQTSSDRFGELVVIGATGMLFFQTTINIGMNIGLFPITGITLPLLSYGGSSVVTVLISIGLISSVAKFGSKKREIPTFGII